MNEQEKREKVIKAFEFCLMSPSEKEIADDICSHEDCPYYREYNGGKCISAAVSDALALLKAQEPRVMTYDELNKLHADDVIWLEDIDKAEVIPAIVCGAPDYSSVLDAVELCAYYRNKYIRAITKDYLERWRCWTSRPTDAQREAVKWE